MALVVALTVLGLLALMALLLWARSTSFVPESPTGGEGEQTALRSSLALLESHLPPREVITRLTSAEDLDFLVRLADTDTRQLFLKERKALLLAVLKDVRIAVSIVVQTHRMVVRHNRDISLLGELALVMRRTMFLVTYGILTLAIRIVGPVQLPSMTLAVHEGAHWLILAHGHLLAALSAKKLEEAHQAFFSEKSAHRWVDM